MAPNRRGGIISLKVNGILLEAKGNFSYNLGEEKREAIVGADRIHGYTEKPQVPMIEGEITDRITTDLSALARLTDVTVTLDLAVGKTVILTEAWFAADGTGNTEEGNIGVRFESANKGREVT